MDSARHFIPFPMLLLLLDGMEMAKLNKALVATLIRDKFSVKKLAMVLPGGAHFHP